MNRNLSFLLVIWIMLQSCQNLSTSDSDNTVTIDTTQYNLLYDTYKEPTLHHRRFKHRDIDSLVQIHRKKEVLDVEEIGKSVENRNIYKLRFGTGAKKVMLWSQMHGDEPTATMALFDLFNFMEGKEDGYDQVRELLREKLTLHFIPMLNPDGAERYTRRNAQYIDLNRDARAGQTAEGGLLRRMAKEIQPGYGFNLHDQHIYYNVPGTKNPVTISLLAPAFNYERETNEVRKGAMQLIVGMNHILQQYVPEAVSKYDDTFTPRGFGDNFQSWGASTVLIESGGKKGDPEKQEIRKLNFIIILNALLEIAQDSYQQYDFRDYEKIPFSASQLSDVVIRNVDSGNDSIPLKTDIAIRRGEVTVDRDYFVRGRISDIGDLKESYGYDDIDAEGLTFIPGKTYTKEFDSAGNLDTDQAWELLQQGYIAVRISDTKEQNRFHHFPLVLFTQPEYTPLSQIRFSSDCNFFLGDGQNLKYAIVNGYLIDLSEKPKENFYKNRIY